MIEVRQYNPATDARAWDEFVAAARNSYFIHQRPYMDYHADRFADCSLIAVDEKGCWLAVLPACKRGTTLSSHAGLTFAGWIVGRNSNALDMLAIMDATKSFLAKNGFTELIYKAFPHIYASYPAEEDLYALWRCGARLHRTLIASAIDLADPIPFDMAYRQDVRRAAKVGIEIRDHSDNFVPFWQLLTAHLHERFGVAPVHNLAEIELLHSRFPDNIRLYCAMDGAELLGGVVVYHSGVAAHSQYTALSESGRRRRILPAIHAFAIEQSRQRGERYFDFGTSNEADGHEINEGLLRQKIASGARAIAYQTYHLPL